AKSPEDDAVDGRVLEHQIRCDSQGGGISQPVEKRRAQPCRRAERRALSQVVDEKPRRHRDGAREAYQHSLQEYPFSTHGSLPLEAPLRLRGRSTLYILCSNRRFTGASTGASMVPSRKSPGSSVSRGRPRAL